MRLAAALVRGRDQATDRGFPRLAGEAAATTRFARPACAVIGGLSLRRADTKGKRAVDYTYLRCNSGPRDIASMSTNGERVGRTARTGTPAQVRRSLSLIGCNV
jgi:hypothetical protein